MALPAGFELEKPQLPEGFKLEDQPKPDALGRFVADEAAPQEGPVQRRTVAGQVAQRLAIEIAHRRHAARAR